MAANRRLPDPTTAIKKSVRAVDAVVPHLALSAPSETDRRERGRVSVPPSGVPLGMESEGYDVAGVWHPVDTDPVTPNFRVGIEPLGDASGYDDEDGSFAVELRTPSRESTPRGPEWSAPGRW